MRGIPDGHAFLEEGSGSQPQGEVCARTDACLGTQIQSHVNMFAYIGKLF